MQIVAKVFAQPAFISFFRSVVRILYNIKTAERLAVLLSMVINILCYFTNTFSPFIM